MNPFFQALIKRIRTNSNLSTKIEGLCKTYFNFCKRNLRIVNNLHLGLEQNAKFGLLGFNGYSKTTIFRAITNELIYEKEQFPYLEMMEKQNLNKIRPFIGYCTQENYFFYYCNILNIFPLII